MSINLSQHTWTIYLRNFQFFFGGGGCCKIRPILLSIINLNQQHITDYKIDNAIFQIKTNIDQIPSS